MIESDRIQKIIAEGRLMTDPQLKGSDLSVLIDKIKAWVATLDLGGIGSAGLHILLHYAIDEFIPKLITMAPAYVGLILTAIVMPLLKKLDEQFHIVPVPPAPIP